MNFGDFLIPDEHVVFKSQHSFVFVNIRPFLPYHLLVSPITRKDRISKLNHEEYIDLVSLVRLVTTKLDSLGESWSIVMQDGQEAGQTVKHVHFHLIPRKKGDLVRNNDIYEKLDVDVNRSNRSFEEMKEEAIFLSKFFNESD
ncbi:hypothetical protein GINT2_001083 [Glugoides intestinalis]